DAVQPTQYRGSLQLRDSEFAIPGANTPLHIAAAKVRLDSDKIAIAPLSAWLGGIQLEGAVEVRRSPASLAESAGASRQIEFQLHTPLINAGELRRIFTPA